MMKKITATNDMILNAGVINIPLNISLFIKIYSKLKVDVRTIV